MVTYKTNHIHQFLSLIRVHTCCRLIQKQQLGFCSKCSGNLQLTLFTVRQVACKIICKSIKAKYFQKLHSFFIHLLLNFKIFWKSEYTCKGRILIIVVQTCFYIVQHCHILKQTDILESSCNTCFIDLYRIFTCNINTVQLDDPFSRLIYTGKKIEYSCFSCSVRSDQAV